MCIIAIKPKNKPIQTKEILERCFTYNRDGAGYMYVDTDNKYVIIKKGFMKFDEFYNSMIKDYTDNKLENKTLIMHFRIGTSGKNKLGCTHPFPISNKMDELELLHCKTNIGICHNGIISGFNSYSNQYSDTQLYISTVITPIIKLNLQSYKFKDVQHLIQETTNSKWAVLDKNDEYYTIGNFVEDNGYYYSNETYKPYTPVTTNYKHKNTKFEFEEDETLDEASSWYQKAYMKQHNTKPANLLLTEKTNTDITVNDKIYKALEIGNIVCADAIDNFYKKELTYMEIDCNDYYFDNQYNIYRNYQGKESSYLKMIGKRAIIYSNESLVQRRGFYE